MQARRRYLLVSVGASLLLVLYLCGLQMGDLDLHQQDHLHHQDHLHQQDHLHHPDHLHHQDHLHQQDHLHHQDYHHPYHLHQQDHLHHQDYQQQGHLHHQDQLHHQDYKNQDYLQGQQQPSQVLHWPPSRPQAHRGPSREPGPWPETLQPLEPYLEGGEQEEDSPMLQHQHTSPRERRSVQDHMYRSRRCRMETCFDFRRCQADFLVFVYPPARGGEPSAPPSVSPAYLKVLAAIRASRFHTADPARACLLVLAEDTLDRDRLSPQYAQGVRARLQSLPTWQDGRNHLVFNLYAGSWPDYADDDLGFEAGQALMARASADAAAFRPGFDVSVPLFPRDHPQRAGGGAPSTPSSRKYLLVFKGKRYLTGIGSETRNALHHLHNGRDIVLLTTCRHGKDWERHKDARCDRDNQEYAK